jgi:hypothetical protein
MRLKRSTGGGKPSARKTQQRYNGNVSLYFPVQGSWKRLSAIASTSQVGRNNSQRLSSRPSAASRERPQPKPLLVLPRSTCDCGCRRIRQLPSSLGLHGPIQILEWARNQSMVRFKPSSKPTRASKPNLSLARDVSSIRRGCPFGLLVSQWTVPL